jgi:hypothetical protein
VSAKFNVGALRQRIFIVAAALRFADKHASFTVANILRFSAGI